jgi:hypothetical protein
MLSIGLKDVPSRGQALDHGSARIQAYRHRLTEFIGGSDSIPGLSGASPHQVCCELLFGRRRLRSSLLVYGC